MALHTVDILIKKIIWLQEIEPSQAHGNEEESILRIQGHLAGPEQEIQRAPCRQQGRSGSRSPVLSIAISFPRAVGALTVAIYLIHSGFSRDQSKIQLQLLCLHSLQLTAHGFLCPSTHTAGNWDGLYEGLTSCCIGGRVAGALGPLMQGLGAGSK